MPRFHFDASMGCQQERFNSHPSQFFSVFNSTSVTWMGDMTGIAIFERVGILMCSENSRAGFVPADV